MAAITTHSVERPQQSISSDDLFSGMSECRCFQRVSDGFFDEFRQAQLVVEIAKFHDFKSEGGCCRGPNPDGFSPSQLRTNGFLLPENRHRRVMLLSKEMNGDAEGGSGRGFFLTDGVPALTEKYPPYSDYWRKVVVALRDLDPRVRFSVALLEMDLEKSQKKLQAPQHFEFVALAILHFLLSLMGIALYLHALG
ncbi:hypothetical protein ACLOJK_012681 [Asimina triloba]